MNPIYDYKQFSVLYVDDEALARKSFEKLFDDRFRIIGAASAREGLAILEERGNEIGLLLTDQRMPGEKGVWLLEKARRLNPKIIRILVTAYADMESAIAAVNTGAIYKYITKPWQEIEMETALKRGLEFFMVQRERDQLLHEKLSTLRNIMVADRIVSLGLLASGLSHHIRNSLVAVKTFLDLAPAKLEEEKVDLNGLRDPDFWRGYYQNAQAQVLKINNLLHELWSASETPSSQFRDEVDLKELVGDVLIDLRADIEKKPLNIDLRIPEALPRLRVDKPKFQRLFELLLKDEIATLPRGAALTISARKPEPNGCPSGEIEIEVADNCAGMPIEKLRLVFDPFWVRSDSPSELGINMMACFFIVHHHGGRIEARSAEGKGTSFIIRMPLDASQQPVVIAENDFLKKVRWSDALWDQLLKSD